MTLNSLKRAVAFIFIFASIVITVKSQNLTGRLVDTKNEPIEFANVILKRDSVLIKGVMSGKDGTFILKEIKEGNYHVTISLIGFKSKIIHVDFAEGADIDLKDVILEDALFFTFAS